MATAMIHLEGRINPDAPTDPFNILPGTIIEVLEDLDVRLPDGTLRDVVSPPWAFITVPTLTVAQVTAFAVKKYGADGATVARSVWRFDVALLPASAQASLAAGRECTVTEQQARAALVNIDTGVTAAKARA
jgi:hypothetical protein